MLPFSLIAFLGGLPVSMPASAWELKTIGVGEISLGIVGGVLFLGIISTALAMVLWNNAFTLVDANLASLTFFAQPVVGTLLGWLFLGEKNHTAFFVGRPSDRRRIGDFQFITQGAGWH